MASLNIFEVIFWEGDGEPDTVYVTTARSHLEAVGLAERDREEQLRRGVAGLRANADAVCLIGESRDYLERPADHSRTIPRDRIHSWRDMAI